MIAEYGCTSCHEIEDARGVALERPVEGRDCYGCHQRIANGTFQASPEELERWRETLPRRFDAPTLRGAARFSREWLVDFLLDPHDLRPNLDAQMPRMPMTRERAEAIADFLGADEEGDARARDHAALAGDATRGADLVSRLACSTCHAAGARAGRAAILAPDLAHATSRYSTSQLISWLMAPLEIKPDTLMPGAQLTRAQAADVVAYLATLKPPSRPAFEPVALRVLERDIRFPEVHTILRARCLHCHNRPSREGPGGTGYSGGWGYEGKRLGLLTQVDVMRGGRTPDGARRDLFERMPDGHSRLVSHLIARHREYAGESSDIVGMPLGQPPLTWEEIEIIHTWAETGRR